jgi:hypothetical protein
VTSPLPEARLSCRTEPGYLRAEELYIAEVDPIALAEVVIDNTSFDAPLLLRA